MEEDGDDSTTLPKLWTITFEALCPATFDLSQFSRSLRLKLVDVRKNPTTPVRFAATGSQSRCYEVWRLYLRPVQVNRLTKVKRVKLEPSNEYKMFDKAIVDATMRSWAKQGNLDLRVFEIKSRLPDVEEKASMVEVVDCLGSEIATLKACFDYYSEGKGTMDIQPALQALDSLGELNPDDQKDKAAKEGQDDPNGHANHPPAFKYKPELFFDSTLVARCATEGADAVAAQIRLDFGQFLRGFFRAKRLAGADNGLKRPPVDPLLTGLDEMDVPEPEPEPEPESGPSSSEKDKDSSKHKPEAKTRRSGPKKEEPADEVRRARVWRFDSHTTSAPRPPAVNRDQATQEPKTFTEPVPVAAPYSLAPHVLDPTGHASPLVDPGKVVVCPLSLNGYRFTHGRYRDNNLVSGGADLCARLYGAHVTRPQLQLMRQSAFWEHICRLHSAVGGDGREEATYTSTLKLKRLVERSFLVVDIHSIYGMGGRNDVDESKVNSANRGVDKEARGAE